MSRDGHLPPGVEHGDEYTDPLVCHCDHTDSEHGADGACLAEDCRCVMFEPAYPEDMAA